MESLRRGSPEFNALGQRVLKKIDDVAFSAARLTQGAVQKALVVVSDEATGYQVAAVSNIDYFEHAGHRNARVTNERLMIIKSSVVEFIDNLFEKGPAESLPFLCDLHTADEIATDVDSKRYSDGDGKIIVRRPAGFIRMYSGEAVGQ